MHGNMKYIYEREKKVFFSLYYLCETHHDCSLVVQRLISNSDSVLLSVQRRSDNRRDFHNVNNIRLFFLQAAVRKNASQLLTLLRGLTITIEENTRMSL